MKLEKLLKKRDQIEAEILRAQEFEKRKNQILSMREFLQIAHLPDEILRREFSEIAAKNKT